MSEGRVVRWYWIMDEKTRQSTLRGGRFSDTEHKEFFIENIESPDIIAELTKSFENGKKPHVEYREVNLGKNRKKVVVTGVIPEHE